MSPLSWVVVGVVVIGLCALVVMGIGWMEDSYQDTKAQLNDRYVEKIEIHSISRGGGRYDDLIVIDGKSRYDCDEDDGWLTCSEDPQPTVEE